MTCPYHSIPETSYWRKSVSSVPPSMIDPIVSTRFSIKPDDKIVTAGSCFAQHISRNLKKANYNYYITEPGHSLLSSDQLTKFNYGVFTARFGNIYTSRQLTQLLDRAYSNFIPKDDFWVDGSYYIDPFRPYIQPNGFASLAEFEADRSAHFKAVRDMVENFDVFIFTLGLTEMWENMEDKAVYAACPGCGVGSHNPQKHKFHNLNLFEVLEDLEKFVDLCKVKNPEGKILLSVSPVPLIATFEPRHVLASTTYSKSVLRVAAQTIVDRYDHVDYFPSYEIITGNFSKGEYYDPDFRDVNDAGVNHAMRLFFKHYLNLNFDMKKEISPKANSKSSLMDKVNTVVCEEENFLQDVV